ncbi:MAG: hypothetical protein ACFFC1_03690 [Promethearchaeota archaeon]
MKDILLNELTGDLDLTNWNLRFTSSNSQYIAQKLKIRLGFFLGEWYLNINEGIPYFEKILVKNPNLSEIEDLMIEKILTVSGVESLESFNLEFDKSTRELTVSFTVKTSEGETVSITI